MIKDCIVKYAGSIALIGALAIASSALADAPTVVLDPIGPLTYATFPQTYNVTGTIAHDPNVTSISELKLLINDVQEGATQNPNFGNAALANFSLPWNITGPGTYTVKVTAKHGNQIGDDSEVVEVSEIVIPPVVITECPAAPAVAGDYMKNVLGIKSNSKTFSRVIKLVAEQTGSKGSLWAAHACDAGYPALVKVFVDSHI